jgi:hypothetical protein
MMRAILWLLCGASIVGVFYSNNLHGYLAHAVPFYSLKDPQVIQVIFAILAGVFATKASDSSHELKKLLKVKDIQDLLTKADAAESESAKERARLQKLVDLVAYEVEQQFAREMLINHRRQLISHWEQVRKLEGILEKEESADQIDPRVKEIIQEHIIRTQYIEYMGKGFLRNVPFVGGFLDYFFGPVWNAYYLKNMPAFNKLIGRKKPDGDAKQNAAPNGEPRSLLKDAGAKKGPTSAG